MPSREKVGFPYHQAVAVALVWLVEAIVLSLVSLVAIGAVGVAIKFLFIMDNWIGW